MVKGIDQARRQLASKLRDLDFAMERMPEKELEFRTLRSIARRSLEAAERTADLAADEFGLRLRSFWRTFLSGAYPQDTARNLALLISPSGYLKYKRAQLGISS